MRIVYFGTPLIAAKVLSYLIENQVEIAAVITKPDRPKGRSEEPVPTPVKLVAEQNSIPTYQPESVSSLDFLPIIEKYPADLFVVVAYGEIIKQHLLDMPALGCINLHASLLPKYRGAAPIQQCIINGEIESGVTIMHMVKKMDAGDMIQTIKVPIGPKMTAGELEEELCNAGSKALLEVIHAFQKGFVQRSPQDHSQATFAPKIELEDCEIKWEKSAQDIHNLVRGVNPQPGAWCFVTIRGQRKRLKIISSAIVDFLLPVGKVAVNEKYLMIGCGKQALKILLLQLEGKKAMLSSELLRGISIDQIQTLTL